MRRLLAIVSAALALVVCGDDDQPADDGIVDRDRPVPADVRAFLDEIADPADLTFTATYDLLNKNGGRHEVNVTSDPPALTVEVDGTAVDADDDAALSAYGIFSGFLAANPAAAIEATARRVDAGDAVFSAREAAGITLECIAVPVQGATPSTACLTPDGIFGFVENPSVRYVLTALDVAAT